MSGHRRSSSAAGRPLAVGLALLLVVATLSGCTGLLGAAEPQPRQALPDREEATERTRSFEALNATTTTVRTVDGRTSTTVARVSERREPAGYRSRVLSVETSGAAPGTAVEGHLTVTNESVVTLYDPEANEVSYLARSDASDDSGGSSYVDVVAAARTNETIRRPTPGVPSLPRVPRGDGQAGDGNGTATYGEHRVRVSYNGTETVAGRETYRLEVDPVSPDASLKDQTVWLDVDRLYPLRHRVEFVAHGDRYEYLTTYRNVTFDPDLPEGLFELDRDRLPPDVEETWFRSYDSRGAVAANVSMPVPDPELPDGWRFERATHRSDDPSLVTLAYQRRDDEPRIRVWIVSGSGSVASNGNATVGSHAAALSTGEGGARVTWRGDDYGYEVRGPVSTETLLRIAESVEATAGR